MSNAFKESWMILEIIIIFLFIFPNNINAHILVYRSEIHQLIEEFNDLPALFGPDIPSNGLHVYTIRADPIQACTNNLKPAPTDPPGRKYVAIIERGGDIKCNFERKVRNAQNASFHAVIIYNNVSDDLEQMSANDARGIHIPSVFVGRTSGENLNKTSNDDRYYLIINDELPFNINTQLILPFSILIGMCFLIMICYMVYKCIREERRLRRHRLPKRLLKKIPLIKYTSNYELGYDMCVICLDEFVDGDKLRILPCRHPYHTQCIDPWLTEIRRNCPICKRKVFTKGETRSNRLRQSTMDTTDTDDDTTPLLQQSSTTSSATIPATTRATPATTTATIPATVATTAGGNSRNNTTTTTSTARIPASRLANARISRSRRSRHGATNTNNVNHGTFNRIINGNTNNANGGTENISSDDENLLLAPELTAQSASQRTNPFNRSNDISINVPLQSNTRPNGGLFSLPIFSLFRRDPPLSVAAPPYLHEISTTNATPAINTTLPPISNNILNPNLSGSFKDDNDVNDNDDDAIPQQSIYEPEGGVIPILGNDREEDSNDSVFMLMPSSQNGIGVCALPNQRNPII